MDAKGNSRTSGGDASVSIPLAHTNTVPTTGPSIGPNSIVRDVISSLYNSFNTMAKNFGFTIPELIVFVAGIVLLLLSWSIIQGLRNRKSFSLHDEEEEESNGDVRKSGDHVGGRVLRPPTGSEGSERSVA